jgi:pSer/pThr/pTyr-binding forkhead associated (FHA) protein
MQLLSSADSQPRLNTRKGGRGTISCMRDESHPLVIGRHPSSNFVIDDPTVSRRHAAIHHEGQAWILEDLGSTNGTRVNGVRVRSEVAIDPGDELGFGAAVIRFAPGGRRLFGEPRHAEESRAA